MFKLIVAGGRDFRDYAFLSGTLSFFLKNKAMDRVEIVSGGARGADELGERFAREKGAKLRVFPADWVKNGKSAGIVRNIEMANYGDALVAFWDGKSRGTRHMIDAAEKKGLMLREVRYG